MLVENNSDHNVSGDIISLLFFNTCDHMLVENNSDHNVSGE